MNVKTIILPILASGIQVRIVELQKIYASMGADISAASVARSERETAAEMIGKGIGQTMLVGNRSTVGSVGQGASSRPASSASSSSALG